MTKMFNVEISSYFPGQAIGQNASHFKVFLKPNKSNYKKL